MKNCVAPDPLQGGNEYGLCPYGFELNFQHAEAQATEDSLNKTMTETVDAANRLQIYQLLRAAVAERHRVMRCQFDHMKDCFICSVAFGLTPVPDRDTRPLLAIAQRLAKFMGFGNLSH